MDVPAETTRSAGTVMKAEVGAKAAGEAGLPLFAKAKAEAGSKVAGERSSDAQETFRTGGLDRVIREIGDSSYTLFVDDSTIYRSRYSGKSAGKSRQQRKRA